MSLRTEKFQRYVRPSDVVFELGVASGWNLARLQCSRRIGCDAAEFLAERVKALGIEFISNPANVPDSSVDVVICHHTLEHLLEPAKALRELVRILKPAGWLILHVPWERERRYARFDPAEPNHHLHGWNAQTLGNLAGVMGFKIESITTRRYGYDRFAANLAARFGVGQSGFRFIRSSLIAIRPLREVELIASRKS
jgi:SAM-dependent methyltransferase